jgi:hypothetical protein
MVGFEFVKKIFLLLIIILLSEIIIAEEVYFKVVKTTPFWININFPKNDNITGEIVKDSLVTGLGGVRFSSIKNVMPGIPFLLINSENKEMLIYADSVIPHDTIDLFEEELLYTPKKYLISSFFIDALYSRNRDLIYLHDKPAWEERLAWIKEQNQSDKEEWWYYAGIHSNLIIVQTSLTFYSDAKLESDLLIKNIKKDGDIYTITVKESVRFMHANKWWNWPDTKITEFFTILLIRDGDYLSLYLNNFDNHIDTFVFVNEEFINTLNEFLWNKPYDFINFRWPRRADGSMDYPPPETKATHRTIDNLRLRDGPTTKDRTITTIKKGTRVQILRLQNDKETIDGITAPWARVLTQNGYIGWCFSGYLEPMA